MLIRTPHISDLLDLRELSIASFVHAYGQFNTAEDMENYLSTNFTEENLRKEISDPELHFLLAFEKGELVGYVKLNLQSKPKGDAIRPLEILRLYTKPNLIGGGIGKEILQAVGKFAKARDYDSVRLDVWQKNFRAVNFYQREGFKICGTTQFLLGKDVQDDFVMIKKM